MDEGNGGRVRSIMKEDHPPAEPSQAVCVRCGTKVGVPKKPVQAFHLLYCVRCGRNKRIRSSDIREFLKNNKTALLPPPDTMRRLPSRVITPVIRGDDIDLRKYVFAVEHLAGSCVCGSFFRFTGKPRCPRCRSTALRFVPGLSLSGMTSAENDVGKSGVAG